MDDIYITDKNGNELCFMDFGNGYVLTNSGYKRISLENYDPKVDYRKSIANTISGVLDTIYRTDCLGNRICFVQTKANGPLWLTMAGYRRITVETFDSKPRNVWLIPQSNYVNRLECVCGKIEYIKPMWKLYDDNFALADGKNFVYARDFHKTGKCYVTCKNCNNKYAAKVSGGDHLKYDPKAYISVEYINNSELKKRKKMDVSTKNCGRKCHTTKIGDDAIGNQLTVDGNVDTFADTSFPIKKDRNISLF